MLTISPAPHAHVDTTTRRLMLDVIIAMLPALAVSIFFFGIGALAVTALSVFFCVSLEWLIQKFILKKPRSIGDLSAIVTGMLLAFNLPSNISPALILLGAVVAIGIAKMSFGGLGNNVFNPALVARVLLLISFPVQMSSWPLPIEARMHYMDAVTGATPLSLLKSGNVAGLDYAQLFFGNMGGSLGEISAFALLLGFVWLLIRRVITWHIPVTILATVLIFGGIMHVCHPETYANPLFHVLSGGIVLGAVFMATDYVTSPMHPRGMVIYGIGIGMITMIIRFFGGYPEGVSFAILVMNALTPLINMYVKPRLYGAK